MTISFFSNHFNHHQSPVADLFYESLGECYHYIEFEPMPQWMLNGGFDATETRPYLIRAHESENAMKEAERLMDVSDVVIIGHAPVSWVNRRKSANKITFDYNERWFKKAIDRFNPHWIKNIIFNYARFRKKRSYMLCASAFTARDVHSVFCFPNKTYKWGYFTKVDVVDVDEKFKCISSQTVSMMWVSRFLDWKHPELPVLLAHRLKQKGFSFHIDMFGSGVEFEETVALANNMNVLDVVSFKGNIPNEQILEEMRRHEIFLFTSDRGEGWGAVLSEAMANGCAVIAGDEIGSAPYLVKNGENGYLFKSKDISSLTEKTQDLLSNREKRLLFAKNAQETMTNVWCPKVAAERFLLLADSILKNQEVIFNDGPCSKA